MEPISTAPVATGATATTGTPDGKAGIGKKPMGLHDMRQQNVILSAA
ncbi:MULTISPECIES: hypothetical protein [unclassified Rhizobium]|nr:MULTISPECIES: hypothetical protein [unclassified Rhizobium]